MKVRVKFRKFGPIRYIGHLDVMRYFQKAIRRAEIDVAYTAGFSPHQIMSFAAPLGVGLESNGEYMDIECNSVTTSQDMIDRLNRVGAPGIEVTSVKMLPEHAGNAMASVAAARYTVHFREGREPAFLKTDMPGMEDFSGKLDQFLAKEQILITKETKTGVKEVNIRPGIYEMKLMQLENTATEHSDESAVDSRPTIMMLVDASSAGNIKPGKVIESFVSMYGESLAENALMITREDVYTNVGTAESPMFVPLDAIGENIL